MTDLHKERRRLNLELAALTEEAYDAWRDLHGPANRDRTPEERKAVTNSLKRLEDSVSAKVQERDIVVRAIRWQARSAWDERAEKWDIPDDEVDAIAETITDDTGEIDGPSDEAIDDELQDEPAPIKRRARRAQ